MKELAAELIVNIMVFLIPIDLVHNHGVAVMRGNGEEYIDNIEEIKKQCDFKSCSKQFLDVFHKVTRKTEYIKLCQLMHVSMLHFRYRVNNKEERAWTHLKKWNI